jgi:hypothetical protein
LRQPIEGRLYETKAQDLCDVLGKQRFAVNCDVLWRQRGNLPVVDADNFPLLVNASAPKFLGVFGLTGGEKEGGHCGVEKII